MRFHRKKRENLDITLVSMIDVLFVLLLFFMVTTTFNKSSELNVQLPQATGEPSDQSQKSINLVISAEGIYSLVGDDGQPHALSNQSQDGLKQSLQQLASQHLNLPFIITADGKTPHQAVITALDYAGQVGFTRITFSTQQPQAN